MIIVENESSDDENIEVAIPSENPPTNQVGGEENMLVVVSPSSQARNMVSSPMPVRGLYPPFVQPKYPKVDNGTDDWIFFDADHDIEGNNSFDDNSHETSHSNMLGVFFHSLQSDSSIIKHIEQLEVEQPAKPVISSPSNSSTRRLEENEHDSAASSSMTRSQN